MKKHLERLAYLLGSYKAGDLDVYEEIELKNIKIRDEDIADLVEDIMVPLKSATDILDKGFPDKEQLEDMRSRLHQRIQNE